MAYPEQLKQRAIELYQGCSATQTLKDLEKEFPEREIPTDRTIRRWRNKKLLKEHLDHMSSMAALLINSFEEVYQNPNRGNEETGDLRSQGCADHK